MANKPSAKRVVYLWGAGATHAEARHLGATRSLLMRDTDEFGEGINSRILRRAGKRVEKAFRVSGAIDIEKVISLLAGSGKAAHVKIAERLRRSYFIELRQSLASTGVLKKPQLVTQLLQLHKDRDFNSNVERLEGFITTNHDGLLQNAISDVYGSLDIGIEFKSANFKVAEAAAPPPPLYQLHGSFTWQFGLPTEVSALNTRSKYENSVWIPPTILKEAKSYPFNKLMGAAYELLSQRCDVLRIVGTSLTQNDWNILSLVFNAQRHRKSNGGMFRVELILPQSVGVGIVNDCSYLRNMSPIGYLSDGRFREYKDYADGGPPYESDLANPLKYWLSEKYRFHQLNGELSASRGALETRLEAVI